jgi:peptide/nickel transport system substrate-binding protein
MKTWIRHAGRTAAAAVIVALLIVGTASVGLAQQPRKRLVWAQALPTLCLDPAGGGRLPDWNNRMNIFSWLVTHKPGSLTEVAPDLAERWTVNQDGTVYTFFLRAGVKWHENYGEVTAEDVKYSWERLLNPATRAPDNSDLRPVRSIEAVDARTVRVTLSAPSAGWLTNIANSAWTAIVNRRAVEERGINHCLRPIGSGPYRVARAEARGGVTLVANDDYYGGRPKIDEVEMRVIPEESVAVLALRSGDIDFMLVREYPNMALLQRVANVNLNMDFRGSTSPYILWLNNTRAPFTDARVRRAMAVATDRKTLSLRVTEALTNRVAHSVIPPSVFGHTEDIPKYDFDRARARRLLAEAGFPNGFRTSLMILNSAYHPATAVIIQAMWRQVGVEVQIEPLEVAVRTTRQRAGDYNMALSNPTVAEVSQILQYFDPRNIPGTNLNLYKGANMDRLIDAQNREINPQRRAAILRQIQQQVAEDMPGIPLWYVSEGTAARSNVRGMIQNLGWWQTRFYLMDKE